MRARDVREALGPAGARPGDVQRGAVAGDERGVRRRPEAVSRRPLAPEGDRPGRRRGMFLDVPGDDRAARRHPGRSRSGGPLRLRHARIAGRYHAGVGWLRRVG